MRILPEQLHFMRSQGKNFVNAPTLAYKTAYGKYPDVPIRGMSGFPKKEWNGIPVDTHLEDKWLTRLNNIKGLKVRSTEEGKSNVRVAHVAFMVVSPILEEHIDLFIKNLNRKDKIRASASIGPLNHYRVMVTYPIWIGKPGWKTWWETVPIKIQKAINETMRQIKHKKVAEYVAHYIWR